MSEFVAGERRAGRGLAAASTVLTLVGVGVLVIVLTGDRGSWLGVLAAVLVSAGAVCTAVGMVIVAVQARRQAGGPR